MAIARSRLRRLLGAALLTGACLIPGARAEDGVGPEPEVKPFTTPIQLRYGGFETFSYTFRADIVTPDGARRIAEGWVMDGSMRPQGERLEWSYRLSNIGRDGVLRERGSLRVSTDDWGKVQEAHVLADRWPPRGRQHSLADSYFDASDLNFPLCCCPREPIRMSETIKLPVGAETMPQSTLHTETLPPLPPEIISAVGTRRSVAAGLIKMEGRQYLVVHHIGEFTMTTRDGTMKARTAGSTYIDTRTCLPRRSLWANTVVPGVPGTHPLTVVHENEVRY